MAVTLADLKAEAARLREQRERAWAEVQQMIGAEEQLKRIIAVWEAPAPQVTEEPKPETR